jgi:hypothetical protein
VKYGEKKPTEEDRKHPEFDDPLFDVDLLRPASSNAGDRGFFEDLNFRENPG